MRPLRRVASTSPGARRHRLLFRLVSDHLHRLQTLYDERFARYRDHARTLHSHATRSQATIILGRLKPEEEFPLKRLA
jgi:hypothetical protein